MENQNNNRNPNQVNQLGSQNQSNNKQPGQSTPASNSEKSDEESRENGIPDRNSGNDDDFGSLTEGTEFASDDSNENNNREIEGIED